VTKTEDKRKHYMVVKSNDLIHRRNNLNLQEARMIIYLISQIKPGTEELNWNEFKIKDFCEVCGIDYSNNKYLKNTLLELYGKAWWQRIENGNLKAVSWIESPEIDEKRNIIKIKFNENLKVHLLQMSKQFTEYSLYYTLQMKSQYSIRVYELLKSHAIQKTWTVEIEELKMMLDCSNYKKWIDFRINVLEKAVKEINKLTDIKIEYEPLKEARSYTKIAFTIKNKKEIEELLEVINQNEVVAKKKKKAK